MSWREAIARAVLGGKVGGPHPGGIRMYHQSPHDIDRFDWGKIGAGQGAQSYGHGFYGAESPKVSGLGGEYWMEFLRRFPALEQDAAHFLSSAGFDRQKAAAEARAMLERNVNFAKSVRSPEELESLAAGRARFEQTVKMLEGDQPIGSRTYELNYRAKPEELLDWDKPFAQQSEHVQSALNYLWPKVTGVPPEVITRPKVPFQHAGTGDKGEALYHNLSAQMPGWEQATEASTALRDVGIPGIRYADAVTRNAQARIEQARAKAEQGNFVDDMVLRKMEKVLEQPTHNYVMFDPEKIDIMAKYALPGMATGSFGALAAQDAYEARP